MQRIILSVFLFAITASFAGESRSWRNPEGTKSFEAEFVSRKGEHVTLLRTDRKEITFPASKLHADDRQWLERNHPLGQTPADETLPDDAAVFDTLRFGDPRKVVATKLEESKMLGTQVEGIFLGRTGLNGIYHTNQKVGGMYCYLFFDWNEDGGLKEITLQTESRNAGQYIPELQPCWKEMGDLLSHIHGKPLQNIPIAKRELLKEGQMLATHLWKIETGGTAMLGTSMDGDGYQVVVRFTQEEISPVIVDK